MRLSANFGDKVASRLAKDVGYRSDLHLADWRELSTGAAQVLIGYDTRVGTPKREEINAFVVKKFDGELMADVKTARDHAIGGVSLVVKKTARTLPLSEKDRMKKISATVFMDTTLNDSWEVKDRDGKKVLVRMMQDDISSIISARRSRMAVSASVSFEKIGKGELEFTEGDTVAFYSDGSEQTGVVMGFVGAMTSVKTDNGTIRVPTTSVYEVIEVNAMSDADRKQQIFDYYSKVYGPDYAAQMVEGL